MSRGTHISATKAARRCLALRIVLAHSRPDPPAHLAGLEPWIKELSPWEKALTERLARSKRAEDLDLAAWQAEPLHALLHELGQCDRPAPVDRRVAPESFAALESTDPVRFVATARFSDINLAPNQLWNERLSLQVLIDAGISAQDMGRAYWGLSSFEDWIRSVADHFTTHGMFEAIDGDFPAFGLPYRALDGARRALVHRIVAERMRAIRWLNGHAPGNKWDRVPESSFDPALLRANQWMIPSQRLQQRPYAAARAANRRAD